MKEERRALGRRRIRRAFLVVASAMALLGAGCSKGGTASKGPPGPRPSSPAQVKIVSPTNGEVIVGSEVKIRVDLSGAKIVAATTTKISPDKGHLHVYLDNQIVSMNFGLTDDIGNVKSGMHVLRVEFVASDHLPFDPRVFTAVTFEVQQ